MEQSELKGIMEDSQLENITFKNCNFSKNIMSVVGNTSGHFKFENSILPQAMIQTTIQNLVLENVTFPKEEFEKKYSFEDLPYAIPQIQQSLTINGKIKDSILETLNSNQLNTLSNGGKPQKMPKIFNGTLEMYDKLKKYIFRGESEKINGNPNYHGSIQKQQSQFLALLQNQSKYHG